MLLAFVFRSWYKTYVQTNVTPLARKLQEAREEQGLSRAQIAVAAGSTEAAVRMWERGDRQPRIQYLAKIAEVTGKPLAWFLEEVPAA